MASLIRSRVLARSSPLAMNTSVRAVSEWAQKAKKIGGNVDFPSGMPELPGSSETVTIDIKGRNNPVYPTPWNKWFPFEPIASTPQIGPYQVVCSHKDEYHFCTCGESASQPWCEAVGDRCAKMPEFVPMWYKPRFEGTKFLCGCKKAPGALCTGACFVMWCDLHPFQAGAYGFACCFLVGVSTAWMFHP